MRGRNKVFLGFKLGLNGHDGNRAHVEIRQSINPSITFLWDPHKDKNRHQLYQNVDLL